MCHNIEITQTPSFAHSLTQITALIYPSVFNSAWSKHTICFCFFFFSQSFSQHAVWTKSSHILEVVCRTSWMLLRDKVKSWAIPDGDGGTSEAIRLGQEAAFCGEVGCRGRKWHTGVKENNGCPAHIRKPKIPVLFIWRRRKWEGKVSLWGKQQ